MKNLLLYIVVFFLTNAAKGQQQTSSDVPQQLSQAYSNRFPSAKLIKWERGIDQYVACFSENGSPTRAYFTSGGEWIRTETYTRNKKNLPAGIKQGLRNSAYNGWSIDSATEIQSKDQSMVRLKVSEWYNYPEGQRQVCRLYFTMDGNLINKEILPLTR
ncbi:MAG TPA: PepSY-like domain-containing protein [Puia sp.]|uniref:PepSY-like domain-containing protein n=1 Tax=Puia sp. TaxID=2045100 RepID=UPI002B8168DB|nr:PepSY-like domain-containing protein [Puia sp.]HVU93661.1 PepSY-like domain-containing protein [Puia sp.]